MSGRPRLAAECSSVWPKAPPDRENRARNSLQLSWHLQGLSISGIVVKDGLRHQAIGVLLAEANTSGHAKNDQGHAQPMSGPQTVDEASSRPAGPIGSLGPPMGSDEALDQRDVPSCLPLDYQGHAHYVSVPEGNRFADEVP